MLDCMLELDYPDPYDIDEEIFETDYLPQFLKDPKYVALAIEEGLTFDEIVEAIYANEYEGFLMRSFN